MKILVMGLSGSGKTFLSKLLQKALGTMPITLEIWLVIGTFQMRGARDKVLE